jgi:hypothetical protein
MRSYLAAPGHEVSSPSGTLVLRVVEGRDSGEFWRVSASRADDNTVEFESTEKFYVRHTTFVLWGKRDTIWVYSGDVGALFWTRDLNGKWNKSVYLIGSANPDVPDGLKELKPEFFR